jgi:hypothetical protein
MISARAGEGRLYRGGAEEGENFIAKFGRYVSIKGASDDPDKNISLYGFFPIVIYLAGLNVKYFHPLFYCKYQHKVETKLPIHKQTLLCRFLDKIQIQLLNKNNFGAF